MNNVINTSACFLSWVISFFRHPVHWAADQSCWCNRSHTHGFIVWVWCCQLSIHIHVLFPQVSCPLSTSAYASVYLLPPSCCVMPTSSYTKLCAYCTEMSQTVTFLLWRDASSRLWTWLSARRKGKFKKKKRFIYWRENQCLSITLDLCV